MTDSKIIIEHINKLLQEAEEDTNEQSQSSAANNSVAAQSQAVPSNEPKEDNSEETDNNSQNTPTTNAQENNIGVFDWDKEFLEAKDDEQRIIRLARIYEESIREIAKVNKGKNSKPLDIIPLDIKPFASINTFDEEEVAESAVIKKTGASKVTDSLVTSGKLNDIGKDILKADIGLTDNYIFRGLIALDLLGDFDTKNVHSLAALLSQCKEDNLLSQEEINQGRIKNADFLTNPSLLEIGRRDEMLGIYSFYLNLIGQESVGEQIQNNRYREFKDDEKKDYGPGYFIFGLGNEEDRNKFREFLVGNIDIKSFNPDAFKVENVHSQPIKSFREISIWAREVLLVDKVKGSNEVYSVFLNNNHDAFESYDIFRTYDVDWTFVHKKSTTGQDPRFGQGVKFSIKAYPKNNIDAARNVILKHDIAQHARNDVWDDYFEKGESDATELVIKRNLDTINWKIHYNKDDTTFWLEQLSSDEVAAADIIRQKLDGILTNFNYSEPNKIKDDGKQWVVDSLKEALGKDEDDIKKAISKYKTNDNLFIRLTSSKDSKVHSNPSPSSRLTYSQLINYVRYANQLCKKGVASVCIGNTNDAGSQAKEICIIESDKNIQWKDIKWLKDLININSANNR